MSTAPAFGPDRAGAFNGVVNCKGKECQLWIEVSTTEGLRREGCAYALAPQMINGQVRV